MQKKQVSRNYSSFYFLDSANFELQIQRSNHVSVFGIFLNIPVLLNTYAVYSAHQNDLLVLVVACSSGGDDGDGGRASCCGVGGGCSGGCDSRDGYNGGCSRGGGGDSRVVVIYNGHGLVMVAVVVVL